MGGSKDSHRPTMLTYKIFLISLISIVDISRAFNQNTITGRLLNKQLTHSPSPFTCKRKHVCSRISDIRGYHTARSTRDDILEDIDGIGEIVNAQDRQADFLKNSFIEGPSKKGLSILGDNVESETLSDPAGGAEALTELGRNNIIKTNPKGSESLSVLAKREEETLETPSLRQVMKFAVSAIGVWLCSPLLSLIDTSTVGLLSGTAQQAALSPAVAISDYSTMMLAFLFTATTNLISAAQEKDRGIEEKPHTTKTLITSLQLSGYVGSVFGIGLIIFARASLRAIIGNDNISPEIFSAAMKYLRIRALGMPAAAIIGSAQSACLGLKDIKSPLLVLTSAAVVNLLGDLVFVRSSHPLIGGAAGAAWATTISQYAALFIFVKWLRNKPKTTDESLTTLTTDGEPIGISSSLGALERHNTRESHRSMKMSPTNTVGNGTSKGLARMQSPVAGLIRKIKGSAFARKEEKRTKVHASTRGLLEGKMQTKDMLSLPNKHDAMRFWPYVLPVCATVAGRVSVFIAMSHVISSTIGTTAMAAHQIALAIFYALVPVVDCLSQTAQSFVPPIYERKQSAQRTKALHRISRNLWKAGVIHGSVCVGVVGCVPLFCKLFTGDASVASEVTSTLPYIATFFATQGVTLSSEGKFESALSSFTLSFLMLKNVPTIIFLNCRLTNSTKRSWILRWSLWRCFFYCAMVYAASKKSCTFWNCNRSHISVEDICYLPVDPSIVMVSSCLSPQSEI